MLYIAAFLVAMLVAVLLIPVLTKLAVPLGLVDIPNERKVHVSQIPRIGGIAIALGALIPVIVWSDLDQAMRAYVLASLCILFFGIWDDRKELNYKIKFLGQIIAVGIFVIYGQVYIQWLPFQGLSVAPLWISLLLTFFALLGITNAVNLVDGLDGLAGGTSLISLGAICLIAFYAGDTQLVLLTLAICGGVFGFLRYNTHPASIFMGDTGSQFLGFSIGVAAVLLTQQSNTALSPVLPLIILGLPILDTLTVMTRRIMAGRSPFSPDKNHFHHRLMDLGFHHYEAVIVIYLVQILLIMIGFTLKYQSDVVLLTIFASFCFGFNGLFRYAESTSWQYNRRWLGGSLDLGINSRTITKLRNLLLLAIRPFIFLTLPVYLFFSIWSAKDYEGMVVLYGLMFVVSAFLMISPATRQQNGISRFVWYSACGLAVFCCAQSNLIDRPFISWYMIILAGLVLLSFLLEQQEEFNINPLDVIVLMCGGVMLYLSGVNESFAHLGVQITHAIIFLYAVELMLNGDQKHRLWARIALSGIFAVSGVFAVL